MNGEGRTEATESSRPLASRRTHLSGVNRSEAASIKHAKQRSDPRARRDWLRFLDPVLTDEISHAGAISYEELVEMAVRPLEGRVSRETIAEWWEYAHRRGWLEDYGSRYRRLTSVAKEDLEARHERVGAPDLAGWAKTLVGWTVAGAIGAATYLSGKYGAVWLAILILCVTVVVALFIASPVVGALDGFLDRWLACRACDWLDGRAVALSVSARSAVCGEVRRLYRSAEQQPAD